MAWLVYEVATKLWELCNKPEEEKTSMQKSHPRISRFLIEKAESDLLRKLTDSEWHDSTKMAASGSYLYHRYMHSADDIEAESRVFDLIQSFLCLKQSAKLGNPHAKIMLIVLQSEVKHHFPEELRLATDTMECYAKQAFDEINRKAEYCKTSIDFKALASCYKYGIGVKKDNNKAKEMIEKAEILNHKQAQ